jgi:hypothetical protein
MDRPVGGGYQGGRSCLPRSADLVTSSPSNGLRDAPTHPRIRLETEAKLALQDKVRTGACQLPWSAVLDLENSKNPYLEHMQAIAQWRGLAADHIMAGPEVVVRAEI